MAIQVPLQDAENGRFLQQQRIARLRAYKERLNYTFKDIAEKSGVPESTVKKVLTGATKNPRRKTVEQMEKALGIKEAIEKTVRENGRMQAKAPKYVSGTSAEKLEDMVPEIEEAVEDELHRTGVGDDGETPRLYTVEDYYNLPDDRRVELIDGVFYNMASPASIHQFILGKMYAQIDTYIEKNGGQCQAFMAPLDVQLDEDDYTMLQPDLLIVCERRKILEKCLFGAPDFVCEIISPSNKLGERLRRQLKYFDAGVREYWEVFPSDERIAVYHFEDENSTPEFYNFSDEVPVAIYDGKLKIDFRKIQEQMRKLF